MRASQRCSCEGLAAWGRTALYVALAALVVSVAVRRLPSPIPADAPAGVFAEERALAYLRDLVKISHDGATPLSSTCSRTVGRLAFEDSATATAQYLSDVIAALVKGADADAVAVDVLATSAAHSYRMSHQEPVTLSYDDLRNIAVRVVPRSACGDHGACDALRNGSTVVRAVLISAHYDTVCYSPGASDNGVQVAVALELLRAVLARKAADGPVVFLFNEAEESGLFGADAFVATHPFRADVAAVINLDSGGGWGQLNVFQMGKGSAWIGEAVRAGSPHPYGTAAAADLYATGIVPSNTDFMIFERAGIPGIDAVFIADGMSYHTPIDDLSSYVPGSIQHAGDNVDGIVRAILATPEAARTTDASMWSDFLGIVFINIPHRVAGDVIAVLLAIGTPLAGFLGARRAGVPVFSGLRSTAVAFVFLLASFAAAVALPAAVGFFVARANTFAWFAHPVLGVLLFGGWSLVGMLAVQLLFGRCARSAATDGPAVAAVAALQLALFLALFALKVGSAIIPLWWCVFLLVACMAVPFDPANEALGWIFRTAWTFFPLLATLQLAQRMLAGFTPFMGRFGVGGDTPILDAAFGALVGFLTALSLLPVIVPVANSAAARPANGKALRIAALLSVAVAVWACVGAFPYSAEAPRRIDLIHAYDASEGTSHIIIGAPNPGTIDTVTRHMPSWIDGGDCQYIGYSYKTMVGRCFGESVDPPDVPMPDLSVHQREQSNATLFSVSVSVSAPESAVFVLWFNGTLRAWSLTPDDVPVKQDKWKLHVASDGRYAVMRRGRSRALSFDADFDAPATGDGLSFELVASYYVNCDTQAKLRHQLPPWTEVWGKSNSPGPVYVRKTLAVAA